MRSADRSSQHFDDPQIENDNFTYSLTQLLPDGIGGLLLRNGSNLYPGSRVTRLDAEGNRTDTPLDYGTRIELIGQDGTAYLHRQNANWTSLEKKAVDVRTWQTKWILPLEWSWLAASPDGGAIVEKSNTQVESFDASGQLTSTSTSTGLISPVQLYGDLIGNSSGSGLRAVSMPFEDATHFDATYELASLSTGPPRRYGNPSNQSAPPPTKATIQEAAVERLRFYNPLSIRDNVEFGGSICRNAQGRFLATFSGPIRPPNSDYVFSTGCESLLGLTVELAGRYHTHGKFGNVGLSFGDAENAQNSPTTPWFVASPCGGIYEYSAFTTPRPWYRWLPSPSDLIPIYGKPLTQRTDAPGQSPCPVDVGIPYPPQ